MAPGPVTAGVTCFFPCIAGSAATGIAKFLRGRAFLPVAGGTWNFFMLLSAGAGVQGRGIVLVSGFLCSA
jgi:hypothetical protein